MTSRDGELLPLKGAGGGEQYDEATLLKCIEVISTRAQQLKTKGLSQYAFFGGVTNLLLVVWVFGVCPSYFWIVYIFESFVLFPIRYRHSANAKPSEVLYWLDFCWIANFLMTTGLMTFLINAYFTRPELKEATAATLENDEFREIVFCMFWGVANGPLLMAVGALGNALIFHDMDNTASVFIHLSPAMLSYTLKWHAKEVLETWPGMFKLDYFDEVLPWTEVWGRSMCFYAGWWALYTLWLLGFGMGCPKRGYDTIFHFTMRGGTPIPKILGWSSEETKAKVQNNEFTVPSALVYMCIHGTCCAIAMTPAVACWNYKWVHACFILLMAVSSIYKGSARYTYYILNQYTSVLKKEFDSVLQSPKAKALLAEGKGDKV